MWATWTRYRLGLVTWALQCHSDANADDHSRPVASHRDSASERAERKRRRSEGCLNSGMGLLPLKKMSLVFGFVVSSRLQCCTTPSRLALRLWFISFDPV